MASSSAKTAANNSTATGFQLKRKHAIESLNLQVEEYEHVKTGAMHIHLGSDNQENVFLVALRTVPHDSTGVAHILEHTALCGSEKYPVRDPFFMMIRRSLNTFMNAFTSSDWTAYPFASQNRKDFNNLLDVYLDAVFFARLDPLDFAQEGHRLEFEKTDDPESPLVYKGVVFNEMKGAMSSITSQLWHTLGKYLYPTTTYHYNSGGDPESIVDLTYEQLKHFYATHYHPSNAIFMTFGDIPAHEHQQVFEDRALNRFERLDEKIFVPPEKRYQAPLRVEEFYPYAEDGAENTSADIKDKTHIVVGWLLGNSTDLKAALASHLLSSILLDNSASPLQHFLETTELGNSPSPLCGLDDSQHELTFVCGIEGSNPEQAQAFEEALMDTLKKVAEHGVPQEDVAAALHQLELQQREVGGDGYPYGLQLILNALNAATHRGDPIGLLDIDPVLNELREAIKDPNYIKQLISDLLINNQHRVRLTLRPDSEMATRKNQAEAAQLAAIKKSLDNTQKKNIIDLATALQKRQQTQDDMSILPKVGIEDIPPKLQHKDGDFSRKNNFPVALYETGTNGLVYQQVIIDLPELNEDELQLLPLYATCLTETGLGSQDYLAIQKRQSQVVGAINAYTNIRSLVGDTQQALGRLVLSAKALHKNHHVMTQLMLDTIEHANFSEDNRIKELVSQIKARREQGISGNGHGLAMSAASAGFGPVAQYSHKVSGLEGIIHLKLLDKKLPSETERALLSERLHALHQKITQQPLQFLLVSDEHHLQQQRDSLSEIWLPNKIPAAAAPTPNHLPMHYQRATGFKEAWLAPTQVNFCAKAFPTTAMTENDAAALTVLGGFLRNGYLHTAIREQGGAYGGGAQQDNSNGVFRFYSYRDPRLTETLSDFDRSVEWLLEKDHDWAPVEEAILGVVSSIDKPASPSGEAKSAFHADLNGRTLKIREAFRQKVLSVTAADLQAVGKKYLLNATEANVVVVAPSGSKDNLKSTFSVKSL